MAVQPPISASPPATPAVRPLTSEGSDGNERLTAAAGAVLIVLLAVIGLTILALGPLLWVHLFVGMLLVGPLLLKLATTGYRFLRYYTSDPAYRRKGPPPMLLRMIAPIVVLTTVAVMGTGVALLFAGPQSRDTLLPLHKVSFIVWIVFTALHVLAHLPAMAESLRADYGGSTAHLGENVGGRSARALSLGGALVAGLVLAIVLIPQFAPWINAQHLNH